MPFTGGSCAKRLVGDDEAGKKAARRGTSLEVLDRAQGIHPRLWRLWSRCERRGASAAYISRGQGIFWKLWRNLGRTRRCLHILCGKSKIWPIASNIKTIYAQAPGSVAAPTAGLHFTPELLANVREKGVKVCFVTLHVGLGTFSPIKSEDMGRHIMHYESYEMPTETAEAVGEAKKAGGRVIAVGTTTMRVLESGSATGRGRTNLFIRPPYRFKVVDGLVTNFHLPRSTLLVLVSAFAAPGADEGRESFYTSSIPGGDCGALPVFQLRRCDADCVIRKRIAVFGNFEADAISFSPSPWIFLRGQPGRRRGGRWGRGRGNN